MTMHIFLMLLIMAVTVFGLRALPFLLFGGRSRVPELLLYLGRAITAAAIAMLVIYSLYSVLNVASCGAARLLPALLASGVTVGLHWFWRNPLISIIAGTVTYMLLI